MPELTPAERRGARWLLALLLVGTLHDWTRSCSPRWTRIATAPSPVTVEHGQEPGEVEPTADSLPPDGPAKRTDLNRASADELDRLPGIGPVLARRIVEHRERLGPFRSADELLGVPGIGARLLERLRPHVTAGR